MLINIPKRFLPADALWNLAISINVYLTLFRKYNATQLKALEWKYHAMCYGLPLIVALTYVFIETERRGKIYGPATVRRLLQDCDETNFLTPEIAMVLGFD